MEVSGVHSPIGRIAARLAKRIEVVLAGLDLSPSQYRVLGFLSVGPSGPSGLAGTVAISRPGLTAVADGLVSRGLVDRRHDPDDRRRVALALTNDGKELLKQADRAIEAHFHEILRHAGKEDADLAWRGLAAWDVPLSAERETRRNQE